MKLKYKLSFTKFADELVAVPLDCGGQFDGVLEINETMKDILELLEVDRTEEELTEIMMEKYKNVQQKTVEEEIHRICVGLKKEGLLN